MTVRELIQHVLLNAELDDELYIPLADFDEDLPVEIEIHGQHDGKAYVYLNRVDR